MTLSPLDWALIAFYFAFSFSIAIYYYRRAGKNTSEFFLSGRNMPWWLVGTSMVATTFAADTPLAITEFVATNGISGNWIWWNAAIGSVLTVFFFARLWRRSGVLTDVEFVEMRYDGQPAAWLRGIKAVYFGLFLNCVVLGWVSLAMETILKVLFPDLTVLGESSFSLAGMTFSSHLIVVSGLILIVAIYSLLSGLWGVVVTDVFQFFIAMTGTVVLAFYVLKDERVGGLSGLRAKLPDATFDFLPTVGEAASGAGVLVLSAAAFTAYLGVQWWSSWYPGAEPGGGGYIAQRMMSAKDERHALFGTLWFTIAHFCVRPWPWIIVALATLVLYPGLENPAEGYVLTMRDLLPSGLLGLLVAAFLAAFMSTISTQLNWGTSYLVNDFWRRFVQPGQDEKRYVSVSRVITVLLGFFSIFVTANLSSFEQAWGIVLSASAGLGVVLILRWYWWRVNAWSELAATLAPIAVATATLIAIGTGYAVPPFIGEFPTNLFAITAFTVAVTLIATFITRPTSEERLTAFYRAIHPGGPGWARFVRANPDVPQTESLRHLALNWVVGVVLVYSVLFGTGYLLFGSTLSGIAALLVSAGAAIYLYRHIES